MRKSHIPDNTLRWFENVDEVNDRTKRNINKFEVMEQLETQLKNPNVHAIMRFERVGNLDFSVTLQCWENAERRLEYHAETRVDNLPTAKGSNDVFYYEYDFENTPDTSLSNKYVNTLAKDSVKDESEAIRRVLRLGRVGIKTPHFMPNYTATPQSAPRTQHVPKRHTGTELQRRATQPS